MPSNPQPAKQAAAKAFNTFNMATFSIAAEGAGDTINVAVQLLDARGQKPGKICRCLVYLSDNADGSTLTATVPTSTLAIGTNGLILVVEVTNKVLTIISKNDGSFDLNVIQSADPVTYYMVVCMPDGSIAVSGAITFAT
jgi:hypothetical protein